MPGRLGDLELPAHFVHVVTLVEQLLSFGELSDHLFGGVIPLFHAVLLAPFWSIRTRITSGSVHGDPATRSNQVDSQATPKPKVATQPNGERIRHPLSRPRGDP